MSAPTGGAAVRADARAAPSPAAPRRVSAALASGEPAPARGPVIVSGLIGGTKGVSRGARLTVAGVRSAGYSPVVHDLAPVFAASDASASGLPVDRPGGVWLVHVNAPEAIAALSRIDPAQWLGRYRIAYWAYELSRVPASWVAAARAFHEIWAPSRFQPWAAAADGSGMNIEDLVRSLSHQASSRNIGEPGHEDPSEI